MNPIPETLPASLGKTMFFTLHRGFYPVCPTCAVGEQSVGVICTAESRFFEPDDFKSTTFKYLSLLYRICGTDSLLNKLHGEFLNLCYTSIKQFLNNKKVSGETSFFLSFHLKQCSPLKLQQKTPLFPQSKANSF